MMSTLNVGECGYDPSRELTYYTERLAAIMSVIGGKRGKSTHAYTKEIRRALDALVYAAWERAEELIPHIASANVPVEIKESAHRECFALLLEGLLRRFYEIASPLPIGSRILLMNMIISSIAEMAQYSLPPEGVEFRKVFFSKSQKSSSSNLPGSEGGES